MDTNTHNTNRRQSTARSEGAATASTSESDSPSKIMSAIEQAEALQASLRDTLVNSRDLLGTLRRERKQARLTKATINSLKELQRLAG